VLLFVYNTKSDLWSKYFDGVHKIISPNTYACSLCSLTYGNFSEKQVWKKFREDSGIKFEFMYRDVFLKKYSDVKYQNLNLPVVLEKKKEGFDLILDSDKIDFMNSAEDLIKAIEEKMH
jgi:hypothetical protein